MQFFTAGALTLLAIVAAFLVLAGDRVDRAPRPMVVFFVCLAVTSASIAEDRSRPNVPPGVGVLVRWTLEAVAATVIVRWSRMRDWTADRYLAIAAATTLTYTMFGLAVFLRGRTNLGEPTDNLDIAGQLLLAALVFLAIWWGVRRNRTLRKWNPQACEPPTR